MGNILLVSAQLKYKETMVATKAMGKTWLHRIPERLRWGETSGSTRPNLCPSKVTENWVPWSTFRRLLNNSKEETTQPPDNLCQCSVTCMAHKCFLVFRGKLLCSSLCLLLQYTYHLKSQIPQYC